MKLHRLSIFALLFATIFVNGVRADDSLSALMQRMRSEQAVRIAYQETRTLALMEQPWRGSGYMYSLPPDTMLKEQLQPERLLMAIVGNDMYYYDPGNDVRHQAELDEDNPMSLNIAVFKALMMADRKLLERMYAVSFSVQPEQWVLRLTAKQEPDSGFGIEISGLPEQQPKRIVVEQADGDSSLFDLRKDAEGGEVAAEAERLLRELFDSRQ